MLLASSVHCNVTKSPKVWSEYFLKLSGRRRPPRNIALALDVLHIYDVFNGINRH